MRAADAAAPYLGREGLLERLDEKVAALGAGHGAFVVLRGSPGSGTTSTARVVGDRAQRRGVAVRSAHFTGGLAERPYGALATILEAHVASTEARLAAEQLGEGAPALARIAPALRARLPGIPPPAPLEAADERLRLFDAYASWLRRVAAQQPLLVALDDLYLADSDATALLDHILKMIGGSPVLVLATWHDNGIDDDRPDSSAAADVLLDSAEVLELDGLDTGATRALLADVAQAPVSSTTVELVQRATGGHPLHAMQLYRHLREEGFIGRAGGDELPAADSVPPRLEDVIAWRVAALPLEARSALTAVACFPGGATAALLAPVAGLTRARLVHALDEPLARGLVTALDGGTLYAIPDDVLRRAVLGLLEPRLRGLALRRTAEALEAEARPDTRVLAPRLCELYVRSTAEGGGAPAGVRHCLIAAEQARAAAGFARGAEILAAAGPLVEHDRAAKHDLALRLVQARAEAGQAGEAVAAGQALLGDRRADGMPARDDGNVLIAAARSLRAWGLAEQVPALVELARRVGPGGVGDARAYTARLELLGEHWQPTGEEIRWSTWQQSDEAMERTLVADGDDADHADLFAPPRRRTHEQTVALLTLSRGWRRPVSLLAALDGACTDLTTRLGRFRDASSWAMQYLAAAERYGSPRDTARALLFVARCQAVLGELQSAAEAIERATELVTRLGDATRFGDDLLLARLTLAHYSDGGWPDLAGALAATLGGSPRPAGLLLAAEAAVAGARVADEGRARPLIAGVTDEMERWPPLTYLRDEALLVALTAAWELGWAFDVVRARALAEQLASLGAGGNHAATPALALARLSALAGRVDEARAAFAAVRRDLDSADRRPLRAITDHDEGVTLAAAGTDGVEATALLRGASDAFAGLGMDGWRRRTERLLDVGFEAAARPGGRLHFTYPAGLSRREADLARLMASGSSLEDAAATLEIDLATAERHLGSALAKLGSDDPSDLPRLARRHGLGAAG